MKRLLRILGASLFGFFITAAVAAAAVFIVPQGGTGAGTLTGILQGNGTSAVTGITASSGISSALSDETGSGALVFATSPSLTTPSLGVATATTINGTAIPSSKTLVVTTDKLSVLAATTSSELAGVISDETGSGALMYGTSPTITTSLAFTTGSTLNFNAGDIILTHSTDKLTLSGGTLSAGTFEVTGFSDLQNNISNTSGNNSGRVYINDVLQTAGDLIITGDDLFMNTNTSGFILVADGTNYNPVAVSGDVTISSAGAVAIGADKVTEAMFKAVDAASDEECLTYETTTGDFEWQTCSSGTGDFVGPASSTDNAIVRFDGTTGKLGQNSSAVVQDDGDMLLVNNTTYRIKGTDGDELAVMQVNSANDMHFLPNLDADANNDINNVYFGYNAPVTFTFGGSCCGGSLPILFAYNSQNGATFKTDGTTRAYYDDNGVYIGDGDGVRIVDDSDGAITFLGQGNGSDEDLTINLDDTADVVSISSSTSVGRIDFGTIVISAGDADPADAGTFRLGNADSICWEASPAGTDVCLAVDSTELFTMTNGLTVTGTVAATTVTGANVTSGANPGHTHTTTSISGIDVSDDVNLTGGRSLTLTGDDMLADAELYTDTKCTRWESPTAADDFKSIWFSKQASTITSIWAESDQTVTFMLQVDDGTPADVDSVDLAPAAGTAEDTSLNGDTTMAAGDRLDVDLVSVASTPTWVAVCWTFTYDD